MLPSVTFPQDRFCLPQSIRDTRGPALAPDELVAAAFEAPVDFPPLKEIVFEGDKIAFVLLNGLENPGLLVHSILNAIDQLDVRVEATVVAGAGAAVNLETLRDQRSQRHPDSTFRFHLHDSTDQHSVAYMAASASGHPIYINRELFDADVVIPVASSSVSREFSDSPSVYPEFSSSETISRFREQKDSPTHLRDEVALADLNIGADLSILSVDGPGGAIKNILFGRKEVVAEQAAAQSDECWQVERQPEGKVVVATIESNPAAQTWVQFFQALVAAHAATNNVKQIVVCCDIAEEPAGEHRAVLELPFETDATRSPTAHFTSDLLNSAGGILQETEVYLKSHLSQSVVEDLGLGFVESDEEIQRIVDRAESGILLRDAHLCRIRS